MAPENDGELTTQRVSAGRRGPLAVALVALTLVGLLAWEPWDRPLQQPTSRPVAVFTTPTPSPSPAPSPSPSPTREVTPSPPRIIFLTPSPAPPMVDVFVGPIGDPARDFVECGYETQPDGSRVLSRLIIGPPRVQLLGAVAFDVRRITWRAAVETNRRETIFSADWTPEIESRRQVLRNPAGPAVLPFGPLIVEYDEFPTGPTYVARVVVVVEWFGRRRTLLGQQRVVVLTYGHGDSGPSLAEGCLTYLSTG